MSTLYFRQTKSKFMKEVPSNKIDLLCEIKKQDQRASPTLDVVKAPIFPQLKRQPQTSKNSKM